MERRTERQQARQVTPGIYICKNMFHSDWGSSSSSVRDKTTRKSVLDVLSAIAGTSIDSICRSCRNQADQRDVIVKHPLYVPAKQHASAAEQEDLNPVRNPPDIPTPIDTIDTTSGSLSSPLDVPLPQNMGQDVASSSGSGSGVGGAGLLSVKPSCEGCAIKDANLESMKAKMASLQQELEICKEDLAREKQSSASLQQKVEQLNLKNIDEYLASVEGRVALVENVCFHEAPVFASKACTFVEHAKENRTIE
eukprot:scpid91689/ scgid13684/ 